MGDLRFAPIMSAACCGRRNFCTLASSIRRARLSAAALRQVEDRCNSRCGEDTGRDRPSEHHRRRISPHHLARRFSATDRRRNRQGGRGGAKRRAKVSNRASKKSSARRRALKSPAGSSAAAASRQIISSTWHRSLSAPQNCAFHRRRFCTCAAAARPSTNTPIPTWKVFMPTWRACTAKRSTRWRISVAPISSLTIRTWPTFATKRCARACAISAKIPTSCRAPTPN